ncbi:amino acid adenylation domain-containing protein [Kitasatospora cinereorecta]|uniref:Amino acid adenylation domain-containing protein n=1 Tax=Kitasatospora cinereorecta TaxID=285560 RepID=A0ABW0VHR6_9ACTN
MRPADHSPDGPAEPLVFELTPAQQRLWFLHRLDPADVSYHMFFTVRLRGPLDTAALRAALDRLTERHQPLRTRYTERRGVPVGVVGAAGLPLDVSELSGADDPEGAARAAVRDLLERPFDLGAGVPLRAALLRLGPEEHVLALVLHHLGGDGWSWDLFSAELPALYSAFRAGRPDPLAPLPLEFHTYADRARERAGADRAYWTERLAGARALDLGPAVRTADRMASAGAFHPVPLEPGLAERLRRLARAERSTVFLVLLTAFQTLLARHCGHPDVCVGTPVAGRDQVDLEPLFGYLSSTVVLRADLAGGPSFRDALRSSRRTFFEAYAHPEVPFEELSTGPGGPFQALFVLNAVGGPSGSGFDGLGCELFPTGLSTVKAPVTLDAWDDPNAPDGGLRLLLGHRLDTLDEAAGAALAARFGVLLAAAVAEPQLPVDRLPLVGAAERERLITAGRGPPPAGPALDGPALLAEQAARTPGAPALVDRGRTVSYRDLVERVSAAAERLRAHGVGPDTVVAVRRERSADLVTDLLAVLTAGGAYTHLDPGDPPERHHRLLATSGAALVLADGSPEPQPVPGRVRHTGNPGPDPADLAYVCHTSGSTGEPKAVMVTRGGLAARVRWMADRYGLGPGDRVLQFASASFDTHAEEIFPTLAAGAALVLLPGGGELLPDFLRTPEGAALTVLDLPTGYWHALVAEPATAWPPALRLLILGGEQARGPAVAAWRRAVGPRVRLVNTYGPTEATVIATATEPDPGADDGADDGAADPPIGRPLADTDAHVLDPHLAPVPSGVPGELYLGGAGLARGYRGAPGRTAERFVPDPFGPPGARLYATGDRVRRDAEGQLHFLGRVDDQLKLRGYRIEPAEVERELLREPEVAAAAVAAHDQALVGYLVPAADAPPPDPAALRSRLLARLPERLVPSRFVLLDRLPLTTGGKVDRAALPPPSPAEDTTGAAGPEPRDDAEWLVADVWSEVLGRTAIGALDDFFALGGHSLHALRVAALLGEAVGLQVPVRLLFEHPVLARLAAEVRALVLADIEQLTDREAAAAVERTTPR